MRAGLGLALGRFRRRDYTSPADRFAASLYAVFGLCRMLSTWTGPLVTVRRSSDNATMDVYAGGDGWLDVAAMLAWCGSASVYVTRAWDQTGLGRHMEQTTPSAQGAVVLAGVLVTGQYGRPAIVFDGVATYYAVTGSLSYTRNQQNITMCAVFCRAANASSVIISNTTGSGTRANITIGASPYRIIAAGRRLNSDPYASVTGGQTTIAVWHRVAVRFRATSGAADVSLDGQITSSTWSSTGNFNDSDQNYLTTIGKIAMGAEYFSGLLSSVILSRSALDLSGLDAALAQAML